MPAKNKSILFLTSHLPYPAISGGRLREYEILRGISKDYNVYLVVVSKTFDVDMQNINNLNIFCKRIKVFSSFDESDKKFFSKHFPQKVKRVISSKAQKYIDKLISSVVIDLIHLESYYMTYFFLKGVNLPVILVAQNIESILLKQELDLVNKLSKRNDLVQDFKKTKHYESFCWSVADKCIALTKEDYDIMKIFIDEERISLIQNGYDHRHKVELLSSKCIKAKNLGEKSIIITGNFQYKPNHDAVLFFINDIFPKIKKYEKEVILYIVGNNPSEEISRLNTDSIKVLGAVPNLLDYITNTTIFACPLRIGGGIKVKMLEAISCNAAIVTTSIGAQGLNNLYPKPFIIADNSDDFADQIISLIKSPKKIFKLKENTKNVLSQLNTWQDSIHQLKKLYCELIYSSEVS